VKITLAGGRRTIIEHLEKRNKNKQVTNSQNLSL
jgi:hypothetical protein